MRIIASFAIWLAMTCGALAERPVRIGVEKDGAACPLVAEIEGSEPDGSLDLIVRAAPDPAAPVTGQRETFQTVVICEEEGEWYGIVYPEEGQTVPDCGLSARLLPNRSIPAPAAVAGRGGNVCASLGGCSRIK